MYLYRRYVARTTVPLVALVKDDKRNLSESRSLLGGGSIVTILF